MDQRLRRAVQAFSVLIAAVVTVVTIAMFWTETELPRIAHSGLMVVGILIAAALLSTPIQLKNWAVLLTVNVALVVVPLSIYEDPTGTSLMWVTVPVLAIAMSGNRVGSRVAFCVAAGSIVGYYTGMHFEWFTTFEQPLRSPWHRGLNALTFLAGTYAIGLFTAQSFARVRANMQSTLSELEQEVAKHEATQSELQAAHRQVIETARVAGMAEVATGVLHNVGNALNTVVVTSQVVRDGVSDGALERRLERLGGLLQSADADPDLLVRYVEAMGRQAAADRVRMTSEMDRLRDAVSHVSQVVSAQQAHARSRGVVEDVTARGLLEEVARLSSPVVQRHGVQLVVDVDRDVQVTTERHQVVQVLENLVRNAAEALAEQPTRRTIELSARSEMGFLRLRVHDNGPGIPDDVRERVFQHGFTTKTTGSGFGLHVSALASKSVGGRLDLDDDVSEGTSFSLWLPARRGASVPSLAPWDEMYDEHAQAS